ncbi:uncharacterized protein ACNLHF_011147 [Anomaloglossus baeobatrachus]
MQESITECIHKGKELREVMMMKAACLIVLVALALQATSFSIYKSSHILTCCKSTINRLNSENIKSYNRTDDKACTKKAFIVELKTGDKMCFNAASKNVCSAIKKFDSKKTPQK